MFQRYEYMCKYILLSMNADSVKVGVAVASVVVTDSSQVLQILFSLWMIEFFSHIHIPPKY